MTDPQSVSAADALVDILAREKVEVVFGVPGGPVMALFDRLHDHPQIRVVLTKHEEAAAYAAYTYARMTGRLGVCIATLGPGATNLLAGLPVAYMGSAPVLAITGQVQTTAYAHGAHQESTGWFRTPNQQAMFAGTVKHTVTCDLPDRFADYVRHSIRIALSGRMGPTHIVIPANLLHQAIEYTALEPAQYRLLDHRPVDAAALREIARRIAAARHPLLFAGDRLMLPDATAELAALAGAYDLPVMVDIPGKAALDEDAPMYLGVMGVVGHKAAERYLKNHADLIVAIGQTFNEVSTLSWDPDLARDGRLIQLDSDPEEIGKVYPVQYGTAGHIPTMLGVLREALAELPMPHRESRAALVAELRRKHPLFDASEMNSKRTPMLPPRIVAELRRALPPDTTVLADSSKWVRWLGRYLPLPRGKFICAHDYEAMGWAVAGVIGARFATDGPLVVVSGDGAFQMHAMELATAVNHRLDIIWLVMNDERLGIIYDLQTALYDKRYAATTYTNPDFVAFAQAFGASATRITAPGELETRLAAAVAQGGVHLFDIRFDPDDLPPSRPRSVLITTEMGLPKPKPSPELTRAMIKMLKDK